MHDPALRRGLPQGRARRRCSRAARCARVPHPHGRPVALPQPGAGGDSTGLTLEATHTPEEINEYVAVLQKLLTLRSEVARVNEEYIRSAAQANDYRTEPPFKLQGSYRNMSKLAEKVLPILNEAEIQALLATHYTSEAQTLTSGTEANLLKLREILGWLTPAEATRWEDIKATFRRNLRTSSGGQLLQVLTQLEHISGGIREALGRE